MPDKKRKFKLLSRVKNLPLKGHDEASGYGYIVGVDLSNNEQGDT